VKTHNSGLQTVAQIVNTQTVDYLDHTPILLGRGIAGKLEEHDTLCNDNTRRS